MRPLLLDTNVLIWAISDERRLSRRIRASIASEGADVRISVVSAWEIAVKAQIGKLTFVVPIEEVLARILSGMPWRTLPVLPAHIPELLKLPLLHRDPFDRLLIAQARVEGMTIATSDANIRRYKVLTVH